MKRLTAALAAILVTVAATLTLGSGTTAVAAAASSSAWGHAKSGNHVLQKGCHSYSFRYQVDAPTADWMAELRLISPQGRSLATHTYTSEADPTSGVRNWRVCANLTRRGVHEIRMVVTAYGDAGRTAERHIKPTTFRFKRD